MPLIKERVPNFVIGLVIGTVLAMFFFYARSRLTTEWKDYPPNSLHKAVALQAEWQATPRPITAADLKGRAMTIMFVTKKCDACIGLAKLLGQVEREFKGDVMTLVVSPKEFDLNAKIGEIGFKPFDYIINDPKGAIAEKLGINRMPAMIFVSPNGQIATTIYSVNEAASFVPNVRLILNQYKGNINIDPIK